MLFFTGLFTSTCLQGEPGFGTLLLFTITVVEGGDICGTLTVINSNRGDLVLFLNDLSNTVPCSMV